MKHWNVSFAIFMAVVLVALVSYFLGMYAVGATVLSSNSQDWGAFGSFLSGILFPASALFGGYHVYRTFLFSAYNQKLVLIRDSLKRLDDELSNKLKMPINNGSHKGKEFREIIIDLSNNKLESTPQAQLGILGFLHNVAIYCESFRYYIELLERYPTISEEQSWLGNLERSYWVERYSTICSRMMGIVGEEAFKERCTAKQLESYKFIFGGN